MQPQEPGLFTMHMNATVMPLRASRERYLFMVALAIVSEFYLFRFISIAVRHAAAVDREH